MDTYPGLSGCGEGNVIIQVLRIGVSESEKENMMVEAMKCRPPLEVANSKILPYRPQRKVLRSSANPF